MVDQITQNRIQQLHPLVRHEVEAITNDINQNVATASSFVRITQGLRTFQEQDALYAQGRTTAGKKVTNAKGGQSIHCYGLAVDIGFIINGKPSWETKADWDKDKQSDWMEVVQIFKNYKWSWGGDWKSFKDMPHFEKTFGYDWKQLLQKYNSGQTFTDANGMKYVKI